MDFENIPPELREKAADKIGAELVELAKAEGVELTDEQLEVASGGSMWDDTQLHEAKCSKCGKTITWTESSSGDPKICPYCGDPFGFK